MLVPTMPLHLKRVPRQRKLALWATSKLGIISTFREFLEALDTPVALACALQLKYGMWNDYVSRQIEPRNYTDSQSFRKDYQAVKGLAKADFLPTTIDRRSNAIEKFWEAEKLCEASNVKFDLMMTQKGASLLAQDDPWMWETLSKASHLIRRILGDSPGRLPIKPRFGPGVTSLVKRRVTLPKKYASTTHVTPGLVTCLPDLLGPLWMKSLKDVHVVRGNTISFVAKNAKTDRAIAVEPHGNVYAQLGVGEILSEAFSSHIKLDFKKYGADLNRALASKAHDWQLSTIDLSMASDTVCRSLVWFLLPEAWATLLDTIRSPFFSLNGVWHESEKFSSMGNGATFELETIIFYALARAAGSSRALTNVFGDDIICERRCSSDLIRVLEFCGFRVNTDKSYVDGAFFESCGSDYFEGHPVRPFFWSKNHETTPFKMVNDISRFATVDNVYRLKRYHGVYRSALSLVKRSSKVPLPYVPHGYGDSGIWGEWDESHPTYLRDGHNGWSTKALRFRPNKELYRGAHEGYLSSLDTMSLTSESPIRQDGIWEVGNLRTFGPWVGPGPWK